MRRLLLSALVVFAACGPDVVHTDDELSAEVVEGELTASPVRLVYAVDSEARPGAMRAVIEVDNLAFKKDVTLRYKTPGGGWLDSVPARYLRSTSSQRDLFVVELTERAVTFAVRYAVGGKVYWDNNGGKNYVFAAASHGTPELGTPVLGAGRNIVVVDAKECAGTLRELCVTMLVRDLSVRLMPSVRYTIAAAPGDGWKLINTTRNGVFEASSSDRRLSRWTARIPLTDARVPNPTSVEFAASIHYYYPTARDFWDKTTTQDFACDTFSSPTLQAWRCINGAAWDRRFALPQNARTGAQLETYFPTGP